MVKQLTTSIGTSRDYEQVLPRGTTTQILRFALFQPLVSANRPVRQGASHTGLHYASLVIVSWLLRLDLSSVCWVFANARLFTSHDWTCRLHSDFPSVTDQSPVPLWLAPQTVNIAKLCVQSLFIATLHSGSNPISRLPQLSKSAIDTTTLQNM